MNTSISRYQTLLLAVVVAVTLFIVSSYSYVHASDGYVIPCHTIDYLDGLIPRSKSFGSPSDLFGNSGQLLMQVRCNNTQNAKVILGNDDPELLIYQYAVELVNGKYKTLQLAGQSRQGDWIFGRAEALLSNTGKGSVFAYMCKFVDNRWKCGCRDSACTKAYWQRQEFVAINRDDVVLHETNALITMKTNKGNVTIELFTAQAPITAGNFLSLAERGFFNDTKFHRVIEDFMIQGGDPLSRDETLRARWGTGGPGYTIKDEFIPGLSNLRGTISMANSVPDTGGSQFFINIVDNTNLDYDKQPLTSKHPVFGKVVAGMDVVDAISMAPSDSRDVPVEPVIIEAITIQ